MDFCGNRSVGMGRGFVLALVVLFADQSAFAERFSYFHEHILGTSLEIQLEATTPAAAQAAEQRVLAEIERLKAIFSSYDPESELCRWQTEIDRPVQVSPELYALLAASADWRQRSGGAFEPAVEGLSQVWKAAENRQIPPTTEELSSALAALQQPQWQLDPLARTATRKTSGKLSFNAIAKGDILDRATAVAMASPEIQGALVCMGGDLCVRGDLAQPVHVVDPLRDAVNAAPIATIHMHARGLATSGNYRRGFQIGDTWHSHILDPRTGTPVTGIASATVVAPTARDADALATIFSVLSLPETERLAATCSDVEYLLVTHDGQRITSSGWSDLEQPQLYRLASAAQSQQVSDQLAQADAVENTAVEVAPAKPELLELLVQFELAKPTGSQYRRPYVAVWLEDADEFPVRTAVLWMQTKQPGPRWHRDLLRWYRNDAVRKLADKRDLIGTVSGATRGSGQYKAIFDGKDDAGQPLPPGKYTLFIEVAREHGTYQLIRHPLTLGADPIPETKLKTNVEIQSASVVYRPATAEKAADK